MAFTSENTNMTASAGLTPGMQTYYNRELLRTFEPELVHLQFGDEHRMPENSGLVMNMRKIIPLEANTTALNVGDPGESVMLTETEVTVKLEQYGEYARCTDKLDLSHLDMNILRKTKLFGDAGARSVQISAYADAGHAACAAQEKRTCGPRGGRRRSSAGKPH